MANSGGALEDAYAEYSNSIQKHVNTLKASFQDLSTTVINSDLLKTLADGGAGVLNVLNGAVKLLDVVGGILPGILGIGSSIVLRVFSLRNLGDYQKAITGLGNAFKNFGNVAKYVFSLGKFGSLSGALNFGTVGVTIAAITALFSIGSKIVNYVKQQRAEKITSGTEAAKEARSIREAYAEYKTINEEYKAGAKSKEEYATATNTLLEALGMERYQIEGLAGEYGDIAKSMDDIVESALALDRMKISESLEAAGENFQKNVKKNVSKYGHILLPGLSRDLVGYLSSLGLIEESLATQDKLVMDPRKSGLLNFDLNTAKGAREAYESVVAWRDALLDLVDKGIMSDQTLRDTDIWSWIDVFLSENSSNYKSYMELMRSYGEDIADSFYRGLESGMENPKTAKEYNDLVGLMSNSIMSQPDFVNQGGTQADAEKISRSYLDSLDSTRSEFELFKAGLNGVSKEVEKFLKREDMSVDEAKRLSKALDEMGFSTERAAYLFTQLADTDLGTISGPNVDTSTALADLTSLRDELEQTAKDIEAYNKAMEGGEKGDSAQTYKSAWEKAREDIKAGKNDSNAVHAAAQLIFGEEGLAAMDYDQATIAKALKSNNALKAIFADENIGLNFGNYLKDNADAYSDFVSVMDNGDGTFDIAIDDAAGLAEALGISKNAVEAFKEALDVYGPQRMMSSDDLDELHTKFKEMDGDVGSLIKSLADGGLDGQEILSTLRQLDQAYDDIDFDYGEELTQMIKNARDKVKKSLDDDQENDIPVDVTVDGGVDAMAAALEEMQAVADGKVIKVHVEVGGDPAKEEDRFERDATKVIDDTARANDDTARANIDKLQELAKAADDAESKLNKMYAARKEALESDKVIPPQLEMAMGEAIAEAEQQLIDAQEALRSFMQDHPELELPLKVDSDGLEEAIQEVTEEAPTVEIPSEFVPKGFVFENKEPVGGGSGNFMARQSLWLPTDGGEGRTKNGSIDLDTNAEEIAARVQAAEDSVGDKSVNINTVADTSGASTAQAAVDSLPSSKTININFKVGKIPGLAQLASGTRNAPGGPTLVNELGPELISEKGRAYIAGGGLPTIVNLSKGAIVLDAEDTKKALDGKKPIVGSIGAAASGGSSTGRVSKANRTSNATLPNSTKSKKKPTYYDSGNNSAKNVEEDKKNKVDWIEVAVDRLTRAIDSLEKVFDSTFRTLDKRMSASNKEIAKIQEGFKTYQDGYERYMKEAESVGLDASIAALVKNGTIDIGKYDDSTKKKIDEFRQWYEKAIDCKEAIDDLHVSLAELYQERFDIVQTNYENQLAQLEHQATMVEKSIDMVEQKGYLGSASLYNELASNESKNISKLKAELSDLNKYFDEAMKSGEIDKGSEAWYEMQESISSVEEAIADANIQLVEYQKNIRDINWEYFDFAQERFSQLTAEAEFYISLMQNDELFDDRGQLTEAGMSTVGMRVMNYDAYMAQADAYAKEMKKIQSDLAKDPYDTELIKRREELLGLQQEFILSAESEKDAVRDMVENGINKELSALKELIDAYKDSVDSAKDLYEYQKKVSEKTKDIATIQKQLAAYAGDTSEENRSRVQKLNEELKKTQEELKEAERDQSISEQKKLLDDLYDGYEELLNERLDNVDALMADMITETNGNLMDIRDEIQTISRAVGYTATDGMQSMLYGDFANYNKGFETFQSMTGYLDEIYKSVDAMARASGAVKAYASGGLADYTGYAMLHGTKNHPELVLNAADTENFLSAAALLRQTPTLSALGSRSFQASGGGIGGGGGTTIGSLYVTIPIDHVQDYNDMLSQMRDDPKFERLISVMTLDAAVGKSSFRKNSIKF